MQTIAIVGLGLIGGSLGLDLVRLGYRVLGVARRPETVQLALDVGAVQAASTDIALVNTADVVIICTPLDRVVTMAESLVPHLQPQAVLTDVGSVKGAIAAPIEALWPNFVGAPNGGQGRSRASGG